MMESIEKLRELVKSFHSLKSRWDTLEAIDEVEREIAERYMPKNGAEIDKTAVQEYNVTVQVAAGQTIEYNTELRHRRGAATSMSVAFRLE